MHFFSTLAVVTSALTTLVSGYANPLSCSGTCTNTHDPAIIRRASDGKYFRFATGGLISIYTAPALQGPWTAAGTVIQGKAAVSGQNTDLWAPDVQLVGDTYYLHYSASSFGTQNSKIGLATSKTLDTGTWTDKGQVMSSVTGNKYNSIDGNLVNTGVGYALNFGSFWSDIYQTPYDVSNPTAAKKTPVQLAYNATASHSEEGSYMVKSGNYWYLFFSAGQCCNLDTDRPKPGEEYSIRVCRSSSYNTGFVDKNSKSCLSSGGTMVLPSHGTIYAPGGQGVYNDPVNGWVLYYHYVDTTVGYSDAQKKLGINKIDWSTGWPVV